MKNEQGKTETLARAAFGAAVEMVPGRMPSADSIREIAGKMSASSGFVNKKSRNYSAMPLAAAMALCLILPALFADKDESLSGISARAASNGSLQRCNDAFVAALAEGGKSLGSGR